MDMDPVYVSKSTARSIWQEYRIFSNRVEIDTKFGLLVIPFEHIESAEVSESEVKGLMRGDLHLKGFRPALKVDWANFVEHVVIDKSEGLIHRILLTPDDPEEFRKILADALSKYGQGLAGGEG
jgi:hypothetical protein